MSYEPKHLKRWSYDGPTAFDTRENYMGANMQAYYVAYGKNRDSDLLTQSNFDCFWNELKQWQDDDQAPVEIHSFNHWACGWYELILIHENAQAALIVADRLAERLDDYPILDESDWSEREFNQACEYWKTMDLAERIDAIKRYGNPSDILHARWDDFSRVMHEDRGSGELCSYVSGELH